ncbi:hypothetical protein [Vitiosangium sp. GDMCC 1.1324]|uniref:hypothetical protein n=1 Tax=Vitiosangium sp. (strain GDMCC 1.1324) TaxID=2138576 RepID=UPI000D3CB8D7|nr:hypothetical protein [Vitiosangium sp. GDMCC 1.1324]PTL77006.1 hypothetical protein DAT35_45995 [Vitiosangium sp. GDMCC 1.1324]
MVKLALLGESFPAQLRENPQALRDVEVVWSGSSVESFRQEVPARRPNVLALDFKELNGVETGGVPGLMEGSGARHAIVTYRFAKRGVLQQYPAGKVRLLQGPISLSLLRAHVHLAVMDDMLQPQQVKRVPAPGAGAPMASAGAPTLQLGAPGAVSTVTVPATPKPPRYSAEQLGVLLEVASAVQCECPNHLSQIVSSLQAFEEYSKQCESRNEADRQLHALLYRYTAAARAVMEEALTALVKHENIQL